MQPAWPVISRSIRGASPLRTMTQSADGATKLKASGRCTSDLFNKESLDGMGGLKHYLLEHRQDQFVGAMVS